MTLDEIQKLCDEELRKLTTPGPWGSYYDGSSTWSVGPVEDLQNPQVVSLWQYGASRCLNAKFTAAMRDLVPRLLEVARAAKAVGCRGSDEMNPEWIRLFKSLLDLEACK